MRLKSLELFGFKSFVDKTTIQFDEGISGVVGPNGCGKCVHGDTRVPLVDGRVVPIRQLVKETFEQSEEIQRMDDGEYTYENPKNLQVLSVDPRTLKIEAKPVLAFVRRTSPETLLKIETRAGREIIATKYHPLFVLENGNLRPIKAEELKVGVCVASPDPQSMKMQEEIIYEVSYPNTKSFLEVHAGDCVSTSQYSKTRIIQRYQRISSDIYWDEIISIEEIPADEEWVYDLCVEKNHNFVANDLFIHNSNIVDAIRWAMGEQSAKHLRGSEMQDVIFNGTAARPPLGMAQVALTFDVSDGQAPAGYADYTEIQVERKLYRSGESKYSINKVPCRLRDVIDLFLGTGVGTKAYSIVEQGQVGRIVSSKPEDRRFLIEEAAGISKFKNRKEAALRKIETTEANLARLNDVIAELKRQLGSLDRQARRAERYREIFEELKGRELKLAGFRYAQWQGAVETLQTEKTALEEKEVALAARLSEMETESEKERLQLAHIDGELNTVQEQFYIQQNAVKLHEAALEYQTNKLKDLEKQTATDAREIEDLRAKLEKAQNEMECLNLEKVALDLLLAGAQEKIQNAENVYQDSLQNAVQWQQKTEEAGRQMLGLVGEIAQHQSRREYLNRWEVAIDGRIAKGQAEVDSLDSVIQGVERNITKTERGVEDLKQLTFKLSDEASLVKQELSRSRSELESWMRRLESRKENLAAMESRRQSLEAVYQNLEGYKEGVRTVLKAANDGLDGICGPVSEIVDTESTYESAVNAALGEKLQYVVVRSQQEGVEAVEFLKQQSKGRSTFVPLDVRVSAPQKNWQRTDGVVGPLLEKVRFNDDYKHIVQYLLGDCILVEDLGKALDLWRQGTGESTLVTLAGEMVDPSGAISGGRGADQELLLGQKRRIETLHAEIAAVKTEGMQAQKEVDVLKMQVKSLEERLEIVSRDSHGEEIRRVQQERDGLRLREELSRLHQERDRFCLEIARALDEKREGAKEKDQVSTLLAQATERQTTLEKELALCQVKLSSSTEEKERGSHALGIVKAELSQAAEKVSACERELSQWVQTKLECDEGIQKRIEEINQGQKESQSLLSAQALERKGLTEALQKTQNLKTEQQTFNQQYEELSARVQGKEASVREVRRSHDEGVRTVHANALKLQETSGHLQTLIDQILERYKMNLGEYVLGGALPTALNVEEESAAVTALREKLEKLGSVHVGAIEEYDELKGRYEFLSKQGEDLTRSLEDLKKAIQKINRISRERFLKTFELVNAKFQEIFPRLFKGGKARLLLVDEQNLMETGVEIYAQPPGKKLQSITLLSGGEKALTAVALIFSIFLIKPSPFCLLDEVDAPLDDANIDRFNDMVKEMTRQSQFIVITHNKRTMEHSDCLYGITMEEAGCSKVVSVRLNEREKPLPKVA